MAEKPTDQDLLWRSIVWVLFLYGQLPQEKKEKRPIRGYRTADGKRISFIIKLIKRRYAAAFGGKIEPDFKTIKESILSDSTEKHQWSIETRNFYSSVVSTYFKWSQEGISKEKQQKLDFILRYANMILFPNGERE